MANKITLELEVNSKGAIQGFKALERFGLSTTKSLEKGAKQASAAWSTFKGVLGAQVLVKGFEAIASTAKDMFGVIAENTILIETLTTEMTTMTGSATKAAEVMERLQNFAATTPFQLEGIAKAAKQLIAFGFEADKITDKLQSIGDVAAGSGSELGEVSLIFGQVAAAGKLTGERLLQFQERAIPIGPAIAKTMGIAEDSVREFVSKGKVDFATFEKAFNSLSQEGGIFYRSMIDKSETLAGVISTLKDNFNLFAGDLGKRFLPIFKAIAKATIDFIQRNKKGLTENITAGLQKGLQALLNILPSVALWMEKAFVTSVEGAKISINGFMAVMDALGLAVAKVGKLAVSTQIGYLKLKGVFTDTTSAIAEATKTYDELGSVQEQYMESIKNRSQEVVASIDAIGASITKSTEGSVISQFVADINKNLVEMESNVTKVKEAASSSGGGGTSSGGGDIFSGAMASATEAVQTLVTGVKDAWANIPTWGQETITSIGSAISKGASALVSTFSAGAEATRTSMDKVADLSTTIADQEKKIEETKKAAMSATTSEEKKALVEKVKTEQEELKKLTKDKEKAEEEGQKAAKDAGVKTVAGAVGGVVGIFSEGAGAFIGSLIELAKDPEALVAFVKNLLDQLPAIIDGIVEALPDIIDAIIEALPDIITAIIDALPTIFETLAEALPGLIVILAKGIIQLIAKLPAILFGIIKGLFKGIGAQIGGDFKANFTKLFDSFKELNRKLVEAPTKFAVNMTKKTVEAFKSFFAKFKEVNEKLTKVPTMFVAKLLKGAADFIKNLIEQIKGAFSKKGGTKIGGTLGQITEGAKKVFKFADGGVVPKGYPNDTFPANLTSGEIVLNKDQQEALGIDINSQQDMLARILASATAPIQVNTKLYLNETAFADIILELNRDNRRLA